jgi:hypothetical protein
MYEKMGVSGGDGWRDGWIYTTMERENSNVHEKN